MTNEHNTDNQRQSGQPQQQEKPDGNRQPGQQQQQNKSGENPQPGQQAQQDQGKPSRDHDSKSDRENQEKEGKGKVATSSPGGSPPDEQRL